MHAITTHRQMKKHARCGFTLTEIAIVLGIIGIVLGAIWAAASRVYANNKTQRAAAQALQIANNYKMLWAETGIDIVGTWTDVTCMGVNSGLFPSDMIPSAACVTDASARNPPGPSTGEPAYPQTPWGGNSYVTVQTHQTNNTIIVSYWNLSQAACNSFANALYSSSADITYEYLGSPAISQWFPPYGAGTRWTASQIGAACSAANNNAVQVGISAR